MSTDAEAVHILLAEDSAGDALLIQQAILTSSIPIKLHIARDGEQALQMLATGEIKPSLIILDLNMPRISGFTFLQRYEPKDIPAVVFSVSPLDIDRAFALELGAREYIQKPIDFQAFVDAVAGMINKWVRRQSRGASLAG